MPSGSLLGQRRRGLVILLVVAVAALALIGGLVGRAYRLHIHEGDRVQQAANRLTVPPAWKYLGETTEAGSSFLCVISCPRPRVTKMYRAPVSPARACKEMAARLAALFAPPKRETWDAGCGWRVPLRSVRKGADVGALAEPSSGIYAHSRIRTDVTVYFSGGST